MIIMPVGRANALVLDQAIRMGLRKKEEKAMGHSYGDIYML